MFERRARSIIFIFERLSRFLHNTVSTVCFALATAGWEVTRLYCCQVTSQRGVAAAGRPLCCCQDTRTRPESSRAATFNRPHCSPGDRLDPAGHPRACPATLPGWTRGRGRPAGPSQGDMAQLCCTPHSIAKFRHQRQHCGCKRSARRSERLIGRSARRARPTNRMCGKCELEI